VSRTAIFLDVEGLLLPGRPVPDPAAVSIAPGAARGLRRLAATGLPIVAVSNQPGVAMGRFGEDVLSALGQRAFEVLAQIGVTLTGFWYCPHHPEAYVRSYAAECACRMPRPGLLAAASRHHDLDLSRSWLIGDLLDHVEAGGRAGCHTILLEECRETAWRSGPFRVPHSLVPDLWEAASVILGARERVA
jgi:histidinol-phosphate phosphatase family protein